MLIYVENNLLPPQSTKVSEKAHSQLFFKSLSHPLFPPVFLDSLKRFKKFHGFGETHCGKIHNIKSLYDRDRDGKNNNNNEKHTHVEEKSLKKQYSKLFQT